MHTFLEWRLFNGLPLTKTAEALDISRRVVAYYPNGEKTVRANGRQAYPSAWRSLNGLPLTNP